MTGLPARRLLLAASVVALAPAAIAASRGMVTGRFGELSEFGEICAAIAALVSAVGIAAAVALHRRGRVAQRSFLSRAAALSGLTAGVWSSVATVALASDHAAAAPWAPLWLFAWPVALLIATRIACGPAPRVTASAPPDPALPRVQLPEAGSVVWERELMAVFLLAGAGLLAVLGSVAFTVSAPLTVVCWVMAALSVLISRMRLRLDDSGVSLAPWGTRARTPLPYDEIAAAHAEHLHPLRWGGARERVLAGDSGLLVRSGPGLVVELADGRRLGILMTRPEVPAGIINAQLDRLHARTQAADADDRLPEGEPIRP